MVICAVGIILWSTFFFIIVRGVDEISGVAKELEEKLTEKETLSLIKSLADDIRPSVTRLDEAFVQNATVADFVEVLEEEARVSGASIQIKSLALDENKKKEPTQSLRTQVEASGSWTNVIELVMRAEKLPRSMVVDKVAFSKKDAGEDTTGLWSVSFEALTYVIQ